MTSLLREKISLLMSEQRKKSPKKGRSPGAACFAPAVLHSISFDDYSAWCLTIQFFLPKSHPTAAMKELAARIEYWDTGPGRKDLCRGTLLMICPLNVPNAPLLIGEVGSRSAAELALETCSIGMRLVDQQSIAAAISLLRSPPTASLALVPVNAALFMYSPVLSRLQSMPGVPLAYELDDQIPDRICCAPSFKQDFQGVYEKLISGNPPVFPGLGGTLDAAQLEGAKMALTRRVTLIQGPPGTGKTYIGAYIANLFVNAPRKQRLLCVAYTNHAIDDFCEGLLKSGINRIVRLGSGCLSEAVAPFTLQTWKKHPAYKAAVSSVDWTHQIMAANRAIDSANSRAVFLKSKALFSGQVAIQSRWGDVQEYLEEVGEECVAELTLREMNSAGKERFPEEHLWRLWLEGHPRPDYPEPLLNLDEPRSCWKLTQQERIEKTSAWVSAADKHIAAQFQAALLQANDAVSKKQRIYQEMDACFLAAMDIVVCTTTAAAKYSDMIKAAQCDVVLVEEAGEVLEAHVLASIYDQAKALILIGDHMQLRPRVNSQFLRVESGKGYNLNISLFERLAKSDFPRTILTTQHRMHPDISRLIRTTYPTLEDSPLVTKRAPVQGLPPGTRVAFISHIHKEAVHVEEDEEANTSYHNVHEAAMATRIVEYFRKQGYDNDQLVVLTPYLGQVRLIVNMMENAVVSGRDANDLHQMAPEASLVDPRAVRSAHRPNLDKQQFVRVSSIDNYQGEESDIVIISLVRGNNYGRMGFVGDPNRMNVLLSRARCGMIILGNLDFLTSVKDQDACGRWNALACMLEQKDELFSGFPAYCSVHKRQQNVVAPDEFRLLTPHGGCDATCGALLLCGHSCTKRCHPSDSDHTKVRCMAQIKWACPASTHSVYYPCCDGAPKECLNCLRIEAVRLAVERRQSGAHVL